mgnify:FL=1
MFYEIRFNGNAIKNICCREYKSDLHAINAAYKALNNQPWRLKDGEKRAVCAEIYKGWHNMQDCEYLATVFSDGTIRF